MTKWEGDIIAYKEHLKDKVMAEIRRQEKAEAAAASNGKKSSGGATATSSRGNW